MTGRAEWGGSCVDCVSLYWCKDSCRIAWISRRMCNLIQADSMRRSTHVHIARPSKETHSVACRLAVPAKG